MTLLLLPSSPRGLEPTGVENARTARPKPATLEAILTIHHVRDAGRARSKGASGETLLTPVRALQQDVPQAYPGQLTTLHHL